MATFSVVIPLYNKARCIARTIRSVCAQTYQDFEVVIVDDGSTDEGVEVVESIHDDRIRLFRQENQGPSAARNKGIEQARGGLIAFLDADDEWEPQFLETMVGLAERFPQAGAYGTAYRVQEPDGSTHVAGFHGIPPAPWEGIIPNYFRSALSCSPVCTSSIVVRKGVLDDVGGFVLIPGLGQDKHLWARIAMKYPIAFSWYMGSTYHRGAENRRCNTVFTHVFASDSFERMVQSQGLATEALADVLEFVAVEKLTAASRYVLGGQPKTARVVLKSCKTRLFVRRRLWWSFWAFMPSAVTAVAWSAKRRMKGLLRRRRSILSVEKR